MELSSGDPPHVEYDEIDRTFIAYSNETPRTKRSAKKPATSVACDVKCCVVISSKTKGQQSTAALMFEASCLVDNFLSTTKATIDVWKVYSRLKLTQLPHPIA